MLAILALFFVAVAVAQQPKPCLTPPQWEANIFEANTAQKFMARARLSYDATYHRERIIEEIEDGSEESFYEILALFDSQVEFVYNFKTKNCTRSTIDRPWRDFGIRPDARSYGEAYIGTSAAPGLGLLVTMWGSNYTTPEKDNVRVFGTWTYQACLPISRIAHSDKYGRSQTSFYDITAGISDPNVFIPRRECLTDKEHAMRNVLFRQSAKTLKA